MNAAARLLNQGTLSRGWVMTVILSCFQLSLYLLMVGLIISSLGIVYVTNVARGINANAQQLLEERDQLRLQRNQLLLERGALSTEMRVQHVAVHTLNMAIPEGRTVVVIHE